MDGVSEEVEDAKAHWCWRILRLCSTAYDEAIDAANSSGAFATFRSSNFLSPPGHNTWRHIQVVKVGRNAEYAVAPSECLGEHFLNLESNCTRLKRLDIFKDADEVVQAIPYLTKWISSALGDVHTQLAFKTTVAAGIQSRILGMRRIFCMED